MRGKKLLTVKAEKNHEGNEVSFMSSDSKDETLLITRPRALIHLFKKLQSSMEKQDSKYQRKLNAQSKQLRLKQIVGRPSERSCPKNLQNSKGLCLIFVKLIRGI